MKRLNIKTLIVLLVTALIIAGCRQYSANEISNQYEKSVVLICNMYYLKATPKDLAPFYIGKDLTGTNYVQDADKQKLVPFITFGSGFFVSKKGLIVTNRHVAYPWEDTINILQKQNAGEIEEFDYEQVFLGVIPNGSMVNTRDEDNLVVIANKVARSFYQCDLKLKHRDPNVDLALIKMQADALPPEASFIAQDKISDSHFKYEKGKEIYMIGFPGGLTFATSRGIRFTEIENTLSSGIISKASDRFRIQYDLSSGTGSSGSPVFDRSGQVIAVNYGVTDLEGALINYGIKAGYIHELLDEINTFSPIKSMLVFFVRLLLLFIFYAAYRIYRIIREEMIGLQYTIFGLLKIIILTSISLTIIVLNNAL